MIKLNWNKDTYVSTARHWQIPDCSLIVIRWNWLMFGIVYVLTSGYKTDLIYFLNSVGTV